MKKNPAKGKSIHSEIKYLGHMISKDGIKPDMGKIQKVMNYPRPRNLKQLQAWHGLANYYSKFIKDFSKTMQPIYKLMRKDIEFVWNDECQEAFDKIKVALTSPPVLAHIEGNHDLELFTDASGFALGAVLEQRNKVVGYASRTMLLAETRYSLTEQEMLSIIFATWQWRHILLNTPEPVKVFVDHRPLAGEIKKKNSASRLMRFKVALSEFNFEIIYRKGKEHGNADGMSRIEEQIDGTEEDTKPETICVVVTRAKKQEQKELAEERTKVQQNSGENVEDEERGKNVVQGNVGSNKNEEEKDIPDKTSIQKIIDSGDKKQILHVTGKPGNSIT